MMFKDYLKDKIEFLKYFKNKKVFKLKKFQNTILIGEYFSKIKSRYKKPLILLLKKEKEYIFVEFAYYDRSIIIHDIKNKDSKTMDRNIISLKRFNIIHDEKAFKEYLEYGKKLKIMENL